MKKTKIIAIILILFFGTIVCGETLAVDQKMLGAELNRPFNDNNGDGTVGNDRYVLEDNHNIFTATKIYDKDDLTEYLSSIYCLRAGKGFGVGTSELNNNSYEPVQYNKIGDIKENAKAVIEEYEKLYGVNLNREEEITFDGITKKVNLYNALLWITDNAYLPKDIKNLDGKVVYNASEYREQLLNKAGITSKQSQEKITDDDIEVVQQFAMWYFVNYDEQAKENFATVSQSDKNIMGKVKIGNGTKFEDYEMSKNTNELNTLYQFFIKSAIENAEKYGVEDVRQTEVDINNLPKLEDTKPQNITVKSAKGKEYSVFGPFEITGAITDLTQIGMYFKNGDNEEEIEKNPLIVIVNNPEDMAPKASSLEEVIGQGQFYIKMPKIDNLSMLKIVLTNSYYETISTAWEADKNAKENQAVVIIEREKITIEDTIETEDPKEFDLSLRKFISSVERDGEKVEIANREPKIYIQDLKNGTATTARYVHPKNLLTLKKGDIITYTLRIYNEGELDGYATLVKDYLPEGLELVEGENVIWTVEGNILSTDLSKNHILYAYNPNATGKDIIKTYWQKAEDDESGLYYLDFKVVCRIKDNVENGQILKNVAEIYNHKAEVENDRDSVPGNVYQDQKHEPGNEVNGYTPGEQDDDDFERVTIESNEIFDLALRKYIVAVNGVELTGDRSREPKVYTKPLQQLETTANYNHKKEPVAVKSGDEITYRFATYNEGNIDGYVFSIIDYLPEYLEFIPTKEFIAKEEFDKLSYEECEEKENQVKYVYTYDDQAKKLTIIEFYNKMKKGDASVLWQLNAYDGGDSLESKYLDLKFKVKDNFISEKDIILTNSATMEYGSYIPTLPPNDYKDRDSEGTTFTVPTQEQLVSENKVAYKGHSTNKDDLKDSEYYYKGQQDDDDFEKIIIRGKSFDLALRKIITKVERNGQNVQINNARTLKIDTSKLASGEETTADYKHRKDPVEVQTGDIVTYSLKVYNEGEIDGTVTKITDILPEGVELYTEGLQEIDSQDENIQIWTETIYDNGIPGISYITTYTFNKTTRELTITRTYYSSKVVEDTVQEVKENYIFKLKAFDGTTLSNGEITFKCKVTANVGNTNKVLTNVARISEAYASNSQILDRDSKPETFTVPTQGQLVSQNELAYIGNSNNKNELNDNEYHYEGQEDDDDFEKLIIKGKAFDLSLRKFITSVERNGKQVEFEDRTPKIDTTTLINGTFSRNGKNEYTATYEHSKEPLIVKQGDIVTYTLRIYNEGERAGYATEITDYIPEGLALIVQHKENQENKWKLPANIDTSKVISLVGQNGFYKTEKEVKNIELEDLLGVTSLKEVQLVTGKVNITSDALKDELLKPFDAKLTKDNAGQNWQAASKGEGGLYYRDVELTCLVIEENTSKDILTNIAEISQDKDENKQDVTDRDSTPNNVNSKNEDDDDYEPIMLKYFDLALRKFITGVESKGTTTEVTSRIPKLTMGQDGKIKYEHSKEPVEVVTGNTVIYTLRVYNEGTIAGYAEEIKDNIPEGLKYLPEHKINKEYEWVMVDKEGNITKNANEAVEITTGYLSKAKEVKQEFKMTDETTGQTIEIAVRENIINPFDSSKQISDDNPSFKDVKVAFEVIEPETSDRIIVNSAQISEDSDNDEDSIPDKWNEGEDDQDKEYIYVKYFDLSLLKWVTKSIVTVDGKTTTTQTGFKPNQGKTETTGIRSNQDAEPIAKVEVDKRKINKTTVKFTYKIRVTNEGEIAGYATEITDYIPEGLEFYPEDETNKKYGWVKTSDSKITTRALETVLLEPNESVELEITFRWKNNANNIGIKTNVAEISEDYNDYGIKDIDSTTDNMTKPYEKEQEDDDDFALVILTIATGRGASYFAIVTTVLAILATGMYLIKKYVLIY